MQLVVVGVNHTTAPLALRERLAAGPHALPALLARLGQRVAEGFVLSTCNRVELYALCGHEESGAAVLRGVLAAHGGVAEEIVQAVSYAHGHRAAVRHLLRVASGLDSLVLGESEILGQVRRALDAARGTTLGPVLERLGAAAVGCGRRVRTTTRLGRAGASVATVAVREAARRRGGLVGTRAVVVGAGETAALAAAELSTLGVGSLTIANRTAERGRALAELHGASFVPLEALAGAVAQADVLVACTAAPTPVVDEALVRRARQGSVETLLCIDLGVPRDVEPAVGALPGVEVIDVDAIPADDTRPERDREIARAEQIVESETDRFLEGWRARSVAPTITRMHARAGAIAEAEVQRALARLPQLDESERAVVAELASRLVGKLLHEPTLALKRETDGANMAMVLERIFGLDSEAGTRRPDDAGAQRGRRARRSDHTT